MIRKTRYPTYKRTSTIPYHLSGKRFLSEDRNQKRQQARYASHTYVPIAFLLEAAVVQWSSRYRKRKENL